MSGPMKTDDLIALIAADAKAKPPQMASLLAFAWVLGLMVSTGVFFLTLGLREDLTAQTDSWRFLAKVLVVWTAIAVSAWDCIRLSRPTETAPVSSLNWLVVGLLASALALEVTTLPTAEWMKNLLGQNWPYCLAYIPTLSLAPLIALFVAFRDSAPSSTWAAGAALGRLGAATGAGLYALHCPDDSPLFVLAWYGIASLFVTGVAAFAGSRLLRW